MLKKLLTGSCVIAVAGFVSSTGPAYAGFEWTSQPEPTSYQQPVQQPSAAPSGFPSVGSGAEIISPVVISGSAAAATATPMPLLSSAPPPAPTAKEKPSMASATLTLPASSSDSVVKGFGSQIPLALALRQILPVGYSYNIDQDVEVDTPVSYKGGKTWRETVKDMLAPVGLVVTEQGASVSVGRKASSAPFSSAAAAPAPSLQTLPTATVAARPVSGAPMSLGTLRVPASDVPMVNVGSGEGWSAQRGDTLHKVLTDWCRRAGVELQWHAEYDYPMEASANFSGDFEDAVRNVLAGFENARPQPVGELHNNSGAGQKLLVVEARGNNYSN